MCVSQMSSFGLKKIITINQILQLIFFFVDYIYAHLKQGA